MLSMSSSQSHSLSSLDRNGDTGRVSQPTASFEFLPSVSFDDLHTSIESASTDFKLTQFPSPTGEGSILQPATMNKSLPERPPATSSSSASRRSIPQPPANRPSRTESILRQPGTSTRQSSVSSLVSSASSNADAPLASSAAVRNRRQSQYPPLSNHTASKQPREPVGPSAAADPDLVIRTAQARRASLLGDQNGSREPTRRLADASPAPSLDLKQSLAASRAAKTKSIQPPQRLSQTNSVASSGLTPEQNRQSTLALRSPRTNGKSGTPSSSKRLSMMPGSHVTGLGARTISPTDTRRMKRLSVLPQSQSLNVLSNVPPPPPPVSLDTRAESRSPSMIPRKTSLTPSSARTTPDVSHRKSYSSGLSIGSTASLNTVRTSTGSVQQRLQPSATPRLSVALQPNVTNSNSQGEDDGDVPPVPAIPKAYESPKEISTDTYFSDITKPNRSAVDSTSIHNTPSGSISMAVYPEPSKTQQRRHVKKSSTATVKPIDQDKRSNQSKKHLEPLRLPPLNIGPLNIPSPKIGESSSKRDFTPPPVRQAPKTPSTPMTASKTSFFSKSHFDDAIELPSLRSSTSIHHVRRPSPTPLAGDSSVSSSSPHESVSKSSMSPFLSSSLPKGGLESGQLKRSKTGGDFSTITGNFFGEDGNSHQISTHARDLQKLKMVPKSPPPEPPSSHEADALETRSPSSKTSLRRKLSLSWKRDKSKGSSDAVEKAGTQAQTKADAMPPPRIPASASANVGGYNGLKQLDPDPAAATPAFSGTGVGSRMRKSSTASLTNYGARDRVKSENWVVHREASDATTVHSSRSASGVMSRVTRSKMTSSLNALQTVGSWATELDKDDRAAEEEMRKLGSRRKETEIAGRALDALKKRATPKERVSPQDAIRIAMLNIYERGEIIDYNDVYFCGTQNARKVVGDLQSDAPNFGYDDERGDYMIVPGDHLSYRYEIVDVLGKGSFGQVVRCVDHKLGALVAIKIIRNKKRFHQQALVEVNILQKLREWVRFHFISFPPNKQRLSILPVSNQSHDRTQKTSTAWSISRRVSTFVGIFAYRPSFWT